MENKTGKYFKYAIGEKRNYALFNFSRSIIFASSNRNFAEMAGKQAQLMQKKINEKI